MNFGEGENTLFISHQNADPDAIGSLYLLWRCYGGDIGLPDNPDRSGKRLAEYLDIEPLIKPDTGDYDTIVVVDTPDPRQLEPLDISGKNITVIDHHSTNLWPCDIIYGARTSCVEVIYDMIKPHTLSESEGMAILAGIISDTSWLRRGDSKTFNAISEVLSRTDLNISSVHDLLSQPRSYSEKICRLKGAERTRHDKVNGYLIAHSRVGAFESSVCSMLLSAGADVAFVASQRDDEVLISGRAVNGLVDEGFDIGKLFNNLPDLADTVSGGGHMGAGVLRGKGDAEVILEYVVREARKMIQSSGMSRSID